MYYFVLVCSIINLGVFFTEHFPRGTLDLFKNICIIYISTYSYLNLKIKCNRLNLKALQSPFCYAIFILLWQNPTVYVIWTFVKIDIWKYLIWKKLCFIPVTEWMSSCIPNALHSALIKLNAYLFYQVGTAYEIFFWLNQIKSNNIL